MPVPESVRGDAGGFDPRDCTTQAQHFDTSTAHLSRCTTVYWSFARRGRVWGIGALGRGHPRCGLDEIGANRHGRLRSHGACWSQHVEIRVR